MPKIKLIRANEDFAPAAFNPKTVTIGGKTWMAENLNVNDREGGIVRARNGQVYYTRPAALRIAEKLKGWRVPTYDDFKALISAAGEGEALYPAGEGEVAADALKAASGWPDGEGGSDKFGFGALPFGMYARQYCREFAAVFLCADLYMASRPSFIQISSKIDFDYHISDARFTVRLVKE